MGLLSSIKKKVNNFLDAPDYTKRGLLRNTIIGLTQTSQKQKRQALGQVASAAKKAPPALAKAIVRGGANVAVSTGETAGRALIGNKPITTTPRTIPGLGAIGPIESYQSKAIREVREGSSVKKAVGKAAIEAATDEPIGVAFKPVLLGAGLLAKQYGKVFAKLAESESSAVIKKTLKENFGKLTDETIEKMAPKISKMADPKAISNLVTKAQKEAHEGFTGFKDLTVKTLDKLKGRNTVSKQFISDLTNSPDLKQAERDLIRRVLDESGDTSPLAQEARKYKSAEEFTEAIVRDRGGVGAGVEYAPWKRLVETDINDTPLTKFGFKSDDQITIYRGVDRASQKTLKEGDYVALSEDLAKSYTGGKVISQKVPASSIRLSSGDGLTAKDFKDINNLHIEAVYNPNAPISKSQLTDIWERANKGGDINVSDFANKVKSELLPLKGKSVNEIEADEKMLGTRYESVNLPEELRGPVANYDERIYSSPIQTSAGSVHFSDGGSGLSPSNYFAHTRIEDLPRDTRVLKYDEKGVFDKKTGERVMDVKSNQDYENSKKLFEEMGTTRRVIEIQSDLYQKNALERNLKEQDVSFVKARINDLRKPKNEWEKRELELFKKRLERGEKDYEGNMKKLEPYRNTWHERIIREEIKKAAIDGKTKLQFPTGETAMKIEGLGSRENWYNLKDYGHATTLGSPLKMEELKVGKSIIQQGTGGDTWIITDVLGDGKFKAVPKRTFEQAKNEMPGINENYRHKVTTEQVLKYMRDNDPGFYETFDISGKVDTNNPIYKFYEKEVGKYLKNKYGAELVTDAQGVKWWEVNVAKAFKDQPVEAFGAVAGIEQDENGNWTYNPAKGAAGVAGLSIFSKGKQFLREGLERSRSAKMGSIYRDQPISRRTPQEKLAGNLSADKGLSLLQEQGQLQQLKGGRIEDIRTKKGTSLSPTSGIDNSSNRIYTPQEKNAIVKTVKNIKTKLIEYVQDSDIRVKKLIDSKGVITTDASDPYLKKTLYPGRVGTKIEEAKDVAGKVFEDINKLKLNRKDVSDYLVARHAPERNAALYDGAAGITTKEANEVFKRLDTPEMRKVVEKIDAIHQESLDILKDSGVISEELFNTLRKKYKHHVPLQRIFDETDDLAGALSGRGFDVRSTGIKSAKGSAREVDDILTNIVSNYEQAVLRSEKNIVDQATLKFARQNKDILGGLIKEIHPKAIGKTFDGKPIMETTQDPSILQMFENGKKVWLKIEDPNLAIALKGVGKEKLGGLLNMIATFTRFYSGLQTRFNPEFAIPNLVRDLQETSVYLASQKGVGFSGATKTALRDPASIKAVTEGVMGFDTEGARLYKEMKEMGGTTGGMGLSTKKNVELNLEKIEKQASSKSRKYATAIINSIDNWNAIFEDSTRLSVYKTALDKGLSKERAAFLAKEASINFNRMGNGGPVINGLYMFANASIQGSAKMLRSLKNPKVLGATILTMGGAVGAVNEWNDKVDPNWRDKVTKYDRLNGLPVFLKSDDDKVRYITIPVSWGLKPIKVMADYAYDAHRGEFDGKKFADDIAVAILEAYNPAGGNDLTSAMSPTFLDTPFEIARNKSWTGSKIRPDFDRNAPADIQYFSSLKETGTGRTAINLSEYLVDKTGVAISPADIKYAFDQYIGGAGRFSTKLLNTGEGIVNNNVPPLDEFPFISRFYRERGADELGKNTSTETKNVSDLLAQQSRERQQLKNKAEELDAELAKLPAETARAKFEEIKKTDPALAEKLKDVASDRKLGLTYTEKLIKQLGVVNGERAKYIDEQIMALPTPEERRAYYEELRRKKLISDDVAKQIQELVKSRK